MAQVLETGRNITSGAQLLRLKTPDLAPIKHNIHEILQKAEEKWGKLAELLVPGDSTLRTREHRRNTAYLALKIYLEWTKAVGIPADRISTIVLGAWLHDMGKNLEVRKILKRPIEPGPVERERVKDHVIDGATKLWELRDELTHDGRDRELEELIDHVALIVYYHHERADGKGDLGVPGEFVPGGSQIISLAETFDASLHGKKVETGKGVKYRKGERPKNYQRAWKEIESKQARWDPTYIRALSNVLRKMTREDKRRLKSDTLAI